ncbi:MAG: hypothetical protein K6U87_06940 [Firmicutes bacterium]|nr:hypothetical protein [Bacillota bacterium]
MSGRPPEDGGLEAIARILEALPDGASHTWRAAWPGPGPAPPAWGAPPAVRATAMALDGADGAERVWELRAVHARGVMRAAVADAALAAWVVWAWTEGWLALVRIAWVEKEADG